jgi:hypothetical protein
MLRSAPNESVSSQGVTHRPQAVGPPGPRADRRRLVQKPGALLLAGEPLELRSERVLGPQEGLLAVQDRRVLAPGVIEALDGAGPQVQLDAPQQGRVRVGLEVGVDEIGDLARLAVQLDQVDLVESAESGSATTVVDAQERIEWLDRSVMVVERIRQKFCDVRPLTGLVDGLGVAAREQPMSHFDRLAHDGNAWHQVTHVKISTNTSRNCLS